MLGINFDTIRFAAPEDLWLLIVPGILLLGWCWQLAGAAARLAALSAASPLARARALPGVRQPGLLAVPDPGERVHDPRAVAADRGRGARAHGRRRSRRPPGRLRLHAHAGRRRQPLAAFDALPARPRRIAGVEGRPHRDGAVRAHRGAAGAAHQGSEYLLLLPRSPRPGTAVPPRGRHQLGHQHRARHRLGHAADREGRPSSTASRRTPRRSCW